MKTKNTDSIEPMFVGDHELWVLIEQAHFAIARARDLELKHYGLTPAQAAILYTLIKNDGQSTQAEIAQYTMRQHHSVSTLINRMVLSGLVKKVKEPKQKKTKITITEKGSKLYAKTSKSSIKMILSVLSEEEKGTLSVQLKSLRVKACNLLGMDYKPPFLPS